MKTGRPLLLLLAALLAPGLRDAHAEPRSFNVGLLRYSLNGISENDTRAAFRSWVQLIGRESGLEMEAGTVPLNSLTEVLPAIRSGSIDVLICNSLEYLELAPHLPPGRLLHPTRSTGALEEYLLLCHRDAPGHGLADFRGKRVFRLTRWAAPLADLWLEAELHRLGQPPGREFFASTTAFPKPARALLPVHFKQADACLVTRAAYETMCELNPKLRETLRVVLRSPPLVASVVWLSAPPDSSLHTKAYEIVKDLQRSAAGRQTMLLFQYTGLVDCPDHALASARELAATLAAFLPEPTAYLAQEP